MINLRGIPLFLSVVRQGQWYKIGHIVRFYVNRALGDLRYRWYTALHPSVRGNLKRKVVVSTRHPIAYTSPDHKVPWGTKHDNTSHKGFVLAMHRFFAEKNGLGMMDLGCAGGQIVREFHDLGWLAVGLEGSDYSLKYKRANWKELGNKRLFTCNIAKPFRVFAGKKPMACQLITAWEVLEHIPKKDLDTLFRNIVRHLAPGGYMIASTTSLPDIRGGVDLHQTKMTNKQWQLWMKKHVPTLIRDDVGLEFYEYVRYNAERSFLVYRKRLI